MTDNPFAPPQGAPEPVDPTASPAPRYAATPPAPAVDGQMASVPAAVGAAPGLSEAPPATTPPAPAVPPKMNGAAATAFVLSLLGILPLVSVIAVILGRHARARVIRTGEGGFAMATAAVWIGWIGVGLWALAVVFLVSATAGGLSSV